MDKAYSNRAKDSPETMVGWPYSTKISFQHNKPKPEMEPSGKAEKSPTKKTLAPRCGGRHQETWPQLEEAGETCATSLAPDRDALRTIVGSLCPRKDSECRQ